MAISLNSFFALVSLAFGYLLGSIPFGLLLTRLAGTADLRTIGSGNIGATNVLRTGRRDLAAATLIGDTGKAMLAGEYAVLAGGPAIVAAVGRHLTCEATTAPRSAISGLGVTWGAVATPPRSSSGARSRLLVRVIEATSTTAAKTAMMPMTTNTSMSVKPRPAAARLISLIFLFVFELLLNF